MDGLSAATIARFWAKVTKDGPTPPHRPELGPCWQWTANSTGRRRLHGQFTYPAPPGAATRQVHIYAHRFAWALAYGFVPDDLQVLHECDNGLCVRLDHLFLGTQADNLADARAKGRLIDGLHARKVSDADVATIRATYQRRKNGTALAAQYGISLVHLMRLIRGVRRPVPTGQRAVGAVLERVPFVRLPVIGEVA